ncbi:MAG: lipopolysaccharide heptosyltransferase II [Bryobacterales bacterium]|nr:lipopolysaccharide heptosyltransferase II [Bryobacterales bacterium]
MSLPALQDLTAQHPDARISVLARSAVAGIYQRETWVSEVILLTAARGKGDWAGKWKMARNLGARQFHTALLLQNAFEAALLVWLARIPERIGYNRDGRGCLLTRAVPVPAPGEIPEHERFYYLELLKRGGLLGGHGDHPSIRLGGIERAAVSGAALLRAAGLPGPVVAISPGAAYGAAKRWLPERFAETAILLARRLPGQVAVFGAPSERPLCAQVAGMIRDADVQVHNFAGETTLAEFIDLAAACRVFITNDSGAMHVASAVNVPTVAVFGPTNEFRTGPTGNHTRVVREPVDCAPCMLRDCPIDHRCMTGVSAARVAQAALELLK